MKVVNFTWVIRQELYCNDVMLVITAPLPFQKSAKPGGLYVKIENQG